MRLFIPPADGVFLMRGTHRLILVRAVAKAVSRLDIWLSLILIQFVVAAPVIAEYCRVALHRWRMAAATTE